MVWLMLYHLEPLRERYNKLIENLLLNCYGENIVNFN